MLLGTLNAPFGAGSGIAAYPIATTAATQQTVYLYGRESAVGRNNISPGLIGADVGTGVTVAFRMDYDQPNSNPDGLPDRHRGALRWTPQSLCEQDA